MLAPWKASYAKTRLCIKKQRHQFADKCPYSQSYGFSSSHVQCDSWAIKKAECWRIDAFKLWCWGRLLRVLWIERRSNQSILKEINPEYYCKDWCWSSNMLATWCKKLTHWKRPWGWERLRQEEKGMTEDKMVGWNHWINGCESDWSTPLPPTLPPQMLCAREWQVLALGLAFMRALTPPSQ